MQPEPELLAVALEERTPVEKVEIRLADLGEDGDPLHGAETGAKGQVAGAGFLDRHPQVAAAGDVGLLRRRIHIIEEARVLQAQLADLHAHKVEHITGAQHEFAQDHDALGLHIALDDNGLDVEFLTFRHLVIEVDVARVDVGLAQQAHPGVQVAAGPVEVLQALDILVDLGGPEHHAAALAENALQQAGLVNLGARDVDVADLVTAALDHPDGDDQPGGRGIVKRDLVLGNLDVEIAFLAVIVAQLLQVVLELVVLETAGVGQPGHEPPFLGLHLLAQQAGLHAVVARKLDDRDFDLRAFLDLEDDRAEARGPVPLDGVIDRDLVVTDLLVVFPDLFLVFLHLAFVERGVGLGFDFLVEARALDLLVALVPDGQHAKLGGDLEQQVESRLRNRLALDFDELEQAGAIERPDVAIDHGVVQIPTLADLHVGADHVLADDGGADKFDRHGADLVTGGSLLSLGRLGRRLASADAGKQ